MNLTNRKPNKLCNFTASNNFQFMTTTLRIERIQESKISSVDFSNLPFGSVYSDHMFITEFIDGEWRDPRIVPFGQISLDPSAKIFHYGQSIFEGMKAYKDEAGDKFLFRPLENARRLINLPFD